MPADCRVRFVARSRRKRRLDDFKSRKSRRKQRIDYSGDGQTGRAGIELFVGHRLDCLVRCGKRALYGQARHRRVLCQADPRFGRDDGGANAARLCFPHGFALAPRSRFDADCAWHGSRRLLLRKLCPKLGTRGVHQSARRGGRQTGGQGVFERNQPVRLAAVDRLLRFGANSRHQAVAGRAVAKRYGRFGGVQCQAGRGRYSRNRVFYAITTAFMGRARYKAPFPPHADGVKTADQSGLDYRTMPRGTVRRLRFFAHAGTPFANAGRPANPNPAQNASGAGRFGGFSGDGLSDVQGDFAEIPRNGFQSVRFPVHGGNGQPSGGIELQRY